jgi:hypothetical protein
MTKHITCWRDLQCAVIQTACPSLHVTTAIPSSDIYYAQLVWEALNCEKLAGVKQLHPVQAFTLTEEIRTREP